MEIIEYQSASDMEISVLIAIICSLFMIVGFSITEKGKIRKR